MPHVITSFTHCDERYFNVSLYFNVKSGDQLALFAEGDAIIHSILTP